MKPILDLVIRCPCTKRSASVLFTLGANRFWICTPCAARAMDQADWANAKFTATPISDLLAAPHVGSC